MTPKQPRAEDKIHSMLLTLIDKRDSFCNGTIPYKEYREYFDEVVRKVAARDQEWQSKIGNLRRVWEKNKTFFWCTVPLYKAIDALVGKEGE